MTTLSQVSQNPIQVFYAYAHEDEDEDLRERLEKHLSLLSRTGTIESWDERQIPPGEERTKVLDQQEEVPINTSDWHIENVLNNMASLLQLKK